MRSEGFDHTEPYLPAPSQEEEGVDCTHMLGGSMAPRRTSSCCFSRGKECGIGVGFDLSLQHLLRRNKVWRVTIHKFRVVQQH